MLRQMQWLGLRPTRLLNSTSRPSAVASVHIEISSDNTKNIPADMMEEEKRLFEERFTQKQKDLFAVERLAGLKEAEDKINDPEAWWNKLRTMDYEELNLMPLGFLRKYGTYMTNIKRNDREFYLDENRSLFDYYQRIKHLNKLLTEEEKANMKREFERAFEPDIVTMKDLERNAGDYMRRQPRIDIKNVSYNFEQYRRYSDMLSKAQKADEEKSIKFYKLVKYVKANKENELDSLVRDFTVVQGFDPNLIEVPDEFQDLEFADIKPQDYRRKQRKRVDRNRTSRDLTDYDAWRCHDRQMFVGSAKQANVAKILVAPYHLRMLFGLPDPTTIGFAGTGEYTFEDSNLDLYRIYDYKQTDHYHGFNMSAEHYEKPRNLKKPLHRRKRAWPTIAEFWQSEDPVYFKLQADEFADLRKFKRWLRIQLRKVSTMEKPLEETVMEKYGHMVDISLGKWDEKGVVNTDMAAHKLDASMFMTKEEHKNYPWGPVKPVVPPKMFDLSEARRVQLSKEQIEEKRKLMEAEKQLEKLE